MTWSHRPALDGVRAVAVYLVLLFHAGMQSVDGGFVGVDLFFVLSGFLVTSVLLNEIDQTGTLHLGRFYARRVRRLLPAAVVVVIATAAVFVLVASVVQRVEYVGDARSALLYYANWHFLTESNDYFAAGVDQSPFLHFWSLSIEEQFYVVYPVVLIGLIALSKRRRWVLPVGLAVLTALSVASQLYWSVADPNHAYYGTDARLYQLLAGGFLAWLLHAVGAGRVPRWLGLPGLGIVLVVASGLLELSPTWRGLLATLGSGLLLLGLMRDDTRLARMFALPIPAYLGRISYGTYLWHWPVLLALGELLDLRPLFLAALAGGLATGLAALSFEVLEMPLRRRRSGARQWHVVIAGLAVSGLVAALLVPPMLESTRKPALAAGDVGAAAGAKRTPVPQDIDLVAASHDLGPLHRCDDADDCYLVRNDGPTILVVGDSHARMLLPMFRRLANEKGFSLAVNVSSGCPWQAGVVNENRPPGDLEQCIADRGEWYDRVLPDLDPALTVMVSQSYDSNDKYDATLARIGGSDETTEELVANTTTETLDQLHDLGARTMVVLDTIKARSSPLDCLAEARFVEQCMVGVPIGLVSSDAVYQAEDVRRDDVFAVDINPVICPGAPLCRPLLHGRAVWRDYNHLTATISIFLRDEIWQRFAGSGALDGVGLDQSAS